MTREELINREFCKDGYMEKEFDDLDEVLDFLNENNSSLAQKI